MIAAPWVLLLGLVSTPVLAAGVETNTANRYDVSPPLRLMAPAAPAAKLPDKLRGRPLPVQNPNRANPNPLVYSQSQAQPSNWAGVQAPSLLGTLQGIGIGFASTTGALYDPMSSPPDTNGEVGPNHYLQIVNTDFAIYDKASGRVLYGNVPTNSLFVGFGGDCETSNNGDGVVLYDQLADRWVVTQFGFYNGFGAFPPFYQCFAVSKTNDPTGQWYRYEFGPYYVTNASGGLDDAFPDYGKFAVWPDGYYGTYNMFDFNTNAFSGAKLCAFQRSNMLAGKAATQQCFQLPATIGGVLPVDFEGIASTAPATGTPASFINYEIPTYADAGIGHQLDLWNMSVNWTTPSNTKLNGASSAPFTPIVVAVPPFLEGTCTNPGPGLRPTDCITEPADAQGEKLDSVGDRMMFRATYRNFGTYGSILANHTVNEGLGTTAAGFDFHAGVRWYELRTVADGGFQLQQAVDYSPDTINRWMASVAQDKSGNVALGYSVSAGVDGGFTGLYPSIRYSARAAGDAGTMELEQSVVTGTGSQTGFYLGGSLDRWGDYSDITVDPVDDCTFWYTTEYMPSTGAFNWATKIGSFRFPNCVPVQKIAITGPNNVVAGAAASYSLAALDVSGNKLTGYNGTGVVSSSDAKASLPSNPIFSSGAASVSVTFKTPGPATLTVTDSQNPLLTGSESITVGPWPVVTYVISGLPATVAPNKAYSITVTAKDANGNTATYYNDTATLSSSDKNAVFSPPTATFSQGVATGITVTFKTSGSQTVSVNDSTISLNVSAAKVTVSSACGCSTSGSGNSALSLMFLVLLGRMLWRRRLVA